MFLCKISRVFVWVWVSSAGFSVTVSTRRGCQNGVVVAPSIQNQRGFMFFSCAFRNPRRAEHVPRAVSPRRCSLPGKSRILPNLFFNLLRIPSAERTRATVSGLATLLHPPPSGGFVPIARRGCHLKKQRKSRRIARVRALVRALVFAGGGSRVSRAGASRVPGRVRRSPGRARPKVGALDGKKLYKK